MFIGDVTSNAVLNYPYLINERAILNKSICSVVIERPVNQINLHRNLISVLGTPFAELGATLGFGVEQKAGRNPVTSLLSPQW